MSTRVDGTNRAVLTLLGVVLLGAGGLGLALGLGAFGTERSSSPVLPEQVRAFAADNPWFWWAVAAGCLLLALLGLRWLLAQLHSDRVGRLDLTADDREGTTTVHASALTHAVEEEAEAIRGIAAASAQVRGERRHRLTLTVDLTEHADLAEVRRALEEQTVAHARQALDDPSLPVDIELRPDRGRSTGRALG